MQNNTLVIEIIEGTQIPTSREFPAKDGRAARTVWNQTAFAHLGGPFPVQMKLPLETAAHAYPVGKYTLDISAFVIGRYGDIEINRYNIKLNPLNAELKKVG